MRSRYVFLALVIVSSSVLPTASVDAGWATKTKVKWRGTKYIARTHAGCWFGFTPVLLCYSRQSSWGSNVSSHCGRKYCLLGYSEAHAYNGPSGAGGWSTKKWLGFAGLGASPDAKGEESESSAAIEVDVDERRGVIVIRFLEGRLTGSRDAESEIELVVGYSRDDDEEPYEDIITIDDETLDNEDSSVVETIVSSIVRVRGGVLEATGEFADFDLPVSQIQRDGLRPIPSVDLSGIEITVPVDLSRRDDIVISLSGDSGAGEVPAVRRTVFLRADSNGDGGVDLGDAVFTLTHQFLGGQAPGCTAAADANGDGGVDLGDAVFTLTHQFLGGVEPVSPFPDCGVSEAENELPCERSSCVQ